METTARTFVDTDVLIDVFRRIPRALDFWRRMEARTQFACSVFSVFELIAGCRNLREQRHVFRHLSTLDIIHVERSDSIDALHWYRSLFLSLGVGFVDCLIAAAAVREHCTLYTLNTKHFRAVPGLHVKRPY